MTPLMRPEYHSIFSSPVLSIKGFLIILKDKGNIIILTNLTRGIRKIIMVAIPIALHWP